MNDKCVTAKMFNYCAKSVYLIMFILIKSEKFFS